MKITNLGALFLAWAVTAAAQADSRATYQIATVAGSGQIGDGSKATAAQMGAIQGVAVDAAGNLYISEFGANRVRKVTLDGNIQTFAGTGIAGYSGEGLPAVIAQLNQPTGVAVDRTGVLYIADSGNGVVRKVLPDGIISTVPGNTPGISPYLELYTPVAVTVDLNQNLYVADATAIVHKYTAAGAWIVAAGTLGRS